MSRQVCVVQMDESGYVHEQESVLRRKLSYPDLQEHPKYKQKINYRALVYLVKALEVEGRLSLGVRYDERRKADGGQVAHRHLRDTSTYSSTRHAAHDKFHV